MYAWRLPCDTPGSLEATLQAEIHLAKQSLTQPRLSYERVIEWAGSARAFGWPAITLLAFWPWFIGSFSEPLPGYELPINIHLFDLLNGLAPASVLVLFRFVLRATKPTEFRGSIARNLSVWLLAAIVGVLVPLCFVSLFGELPALYLTGIPIGIASNLGQILAYSTVTIVVADLRQSAKQLAKKQHALSVTRAGLQERIAQQREDLNAVVEGRLSAQIVEIQSQLSQLGRRASGISAAAVADKIIATIDGVVRPLSLEIAELEQADNRREIRSLREIERQIKRLPVSQRLKIRLPLSHVFNVTFVVLGLGLFVLPSYGFLFGFTAVLQIAMPASIFTVCVVTLARHLTRQIQSNYLLALAEAGISAALISLPFIILGELFLPSADQGLGHYLALQSFIVCAAIFYGSLFAETSYLILDRAKTANNELRRLVGFLQNESQINRRAMAQVVHGKVQARLQAASIKLKQAHEVTDSLLAEIATDLSATILDTADTSLDRASIQEQLDEMSKQWAGICDLTFTLEPGVSEVVDANAVTKAAVVEVIREAVNNAVKHGDADEADSVVTLIHPDELKVIIRNAVYSGSAAQQDTHPRGYGSQVLDQITDGWQLEFEDGDAIVTAIIKVSGASL